MTDEELEEEGWHGRIGANPAVLELEDGSLLYPSQDPEGNGPGALFGVNAEGEMVFINPKPEVDEPE